MSHVSKAMGAVAQGVYACAASILLMSGAQAAEFIPLGDLAGGGFGSNASRISDDGSVLVGQSQTTDAPATYWAFTFIEALARAGVTAGCGSNNYCSSAPVSRAQMAVFLERGMNGGGNYCPESPVTRDQIVVFLVRIFGL